MFEQKVDGFRLGGLCIWEACDSFIDALYTGSSTLSISPTTLLLLLLVLI